MVANILTCLYFSVTWPWPFQMKMLVVSMAQRLEEIEAGLKKGCDEAWRQRRWWALTNLCCCLYPAVADYVFYCLNLCTFFLHKRLQLSCFIPNTFFLSAGEHYVPLLPCARERTYTYSHHPLGFVLKTSSETKSACTCNQSSCHLGSSQRLLCGSSAE